MSFRSSYNIAKKLASDQKDDIKTHGKASEVQISPSDTNVPATLGNMVVDQQLTLLMDVNGMVDYKAEIARLQKEL